MFFSHSIPRHDWRRHSDRQSHSREAETWFAFSFMIRMHKITINICNFRSHRALYSAFKRHYRTISACYCCNLYTNGQLHYDGWMEKFSKRSCKLCVFHLQLLTQLILHTLVSFAGLAFLSFFIAGKLHLFDHRGRAVSQNSV